MHKARFNLETAIWNQLWLDRFQLRVTGLVMDSDWTPRWRWSWLGLHQQLNCQLGWLIFTMYKRSKNGEFCLPFHDRHSTLSRPLIMQYNPHLPPLPFCASHVRPNNSQTCHKKRVIITMMFSYQTLSTRIYKNSQDEIITIPRHYVYIK